MITKKILAFLEWNKNIFISSIKKIDFNIMLIIILDISFYILSAFMFIAWSNQIRAKMQSTSLPSPESLVALGIKRAQQAAAEARAFLFLLIFSIILMSMAVIFLASILKGVIWAKTTKTKITFKLISKFLVLNLIWMVFWFALIILISYFVEKSSLLFFATTAIALGLFFTNTLYTVFMKNQKLTSILEAIKINITKIHLFLLPYTIILILFFIFARMGSLLKFQYSAILLALMIVTYSAVVRYYTSTLVEKITFPK